MPQGIRFNVIFKPEQEVRRDPEDEIWSDQSPELTFAERQWE